METAHTHKAEVITATVLVFALVVESGATPGASLTVDSAPALVGTSSVCQLQLQDPQVSRRHIEVTATPIGLLVRDLGSTNGTWLGETRIKEAYLELGARLRIGQTTLRVDRGSVEAAGEIIEAPSFGRMVGVSPSSRRLFAQGKRLAPLDTPVLIEGPEGSGRELFAESLHDEGGRRDKPFLLFDCEEPLPQLVSEFLFRPRQGFVHQASSGTLLLTEPAALPDDAQRRLLWLLQRGEISDGANPPIKVDLRILAISTVNLDRYVERGQFREDLFLALARDRVELRPLDERRDDIPVLAQVFWTRFGREGSVPSHLLRQLTAREWPRNVDELEGHIAVLLSGGSADDAPASFIESVIDRELPLAQARQEVVDYFERRYVKKLLDRHGGNVTHAAQASGVARRYFRLLKSRYSGR